MRELISQTQTRRAGAVSTELLLLATLKIIGARGAFPDEVAPMLICLRQNYPADPSEGIADGLEPESRVRHIAAYLKWGNCLDERGISLRLSAKGEARMREQLSAHFPDEYAIGLFWAQVLDAVRRR